MIGAFRGLERGSFSSHGGPLLRVALIGAGPIGREHLRAFSDIPDVQVVGIHSRTREKAEVVASEFEVPRVYDSVAGLFDGTQADLAVVAVNVLSMNEVCRACFEFPWKVFVEKPPGYNWEDAVAIQSAARNSERQVWVALNRRFLSSTRAVYDDVRLSTGPRYIHVEDQQSLVAAMALGHPELVIRNWMFGGSIHLVDYFRVFGRGAVTSISRVLPWNPADPGVVLVKLDFASGDQGLYEGLWHSPGPWGVSVTTAKRRWEMRPLEQATFQDAGERRRVEIERDSWDLAFKPGFRCQAAQVVNAARGQPNRAVTLDDAIQTMRLIKDIFTQ